jgi:hypothetical protein
MVTVFPFVGTVPAKDTVPEAGARTIDPVSDAMSMPRCCPPAYGWLRSKTNGFKTSPLTGQLQAPAAGASTSAATALASRTLILSPLFSDWTTEWTKVASRSAVVKSDYRERR